MRIYGDTMFGNCLKVKWVAERLGLVHEWVDVDILKGETRTDAFLALNAFGQVPVVVFDDGRTPAQSNAIIVHFAQDSALVPADPYQRARMFEWLFWEQYSHEPAIAVRRFQKQYLGRADDEIAPALMDKGNRALAHMAQTLEMHDWLAGGAEITLADIALLADTRLAHEGGFDLAAFPAARAWVTRCERELGLAPAP